ncbi:hypothetical protein ACHAPT_002213 [Fusarium lateritium]
MEFHRCKEQRVNKVYERVKNQKPKDAVDVDVRGRTFQLYSADHVRDGFVGMGREYMAKHVCFSKDKDLHGHFYIHARIACNFKSLPTPGRGGLQELTAVSEDGDEKLSFQFLDNKHLILKASRKVVYDKRKYSAPGGPARSAPDTYTFMGIADPQGGRRMGVGRCVDGQGLEDLWGPPPPWLR